MMCPCAAMASFAPPCLADESGRVGRSRIVSATPFPNPLAGAKGARPFNSQPAATPVQLITLYCALRTYIVLRHWYDPSMCPTAAPPLRGDNSRTRRPVPVVPVQIPAPVPAPLPAPASVPLPHGRRPWHPRVALASPENSGRLARAVAGRVSTSKSAASPSTLGPSVTNQRV
jgi:hypothetical protein